MQKLFFPSAIGVLAIVTVFTLYPRWRTLHWTKFSEPTTDALVQTPNDPLKNIRFTVYDVALYPREFEVPAGRVAMSFEDRTGKNSRFVVQRISGSVPEKVGEIAFPKDFWRSRGEMRLAPGRYRVFSPELPEIQSLVIANP